MTVTPLERVLGRDSRCLFEQGYGWIFQNIEEIQKGRLASTFSLPYTSFLKSILPM